jgi:hypothetical protein
VLSGVLLAPSHVRPSPLARVDVARPRFSPRDDHHGPETIMDGRFRRLKLPSDDPVVRADSHGVRGARDAVVAEGWRRRYGVR